jgi:ATP-dependent Clp protease adapter protein ClpS
MFYAWVPGSIHLLLGLLATASGVVLFGLLALRLLALRLWTLRLWTWLYVAATVACGAARLALPGETQSPYAWIDVIPLVVLPVSFLTLRLIRGAGLWWGAIYAAFATLVAHVAVSSSPFAGLGGIVPRPEPPELPALGVLGVLTIIGSSMTRSRQTGHAPPPVRISPNLERSLDQAAALVREGNHGRATSEHVLLALTGDPDAAPVMRACHVDIEALRHALSASLAVQTAAPEGASPTPDAGKPFVVQLAVKSGVREVNGARVLVQMMAEPAGEFLRQAGMTRFHAVNYISHGVIDPPGFGEGETPAADGEQTAGPAMLEVRLLNDDFTPMEFVVEVLQRVFDYDWDGAARLMLDIHRNGAGTCGTYPANIARLKATQVMTQARTQEHPLRCVLGEP